MECFLGGRGSLKGLLQLDDPGGLPLGFLGGQGLPEVGGCLWRLPGHCLGLLYLLELHRCRQLLWHWRLALGCLPDDGWAVHSLWGRWCDRQRGRQHWLGHLQASGRHRGYLPSWWGRRHLRGRLHLWGRQPSLRGLPQWRWRWQGLPELWLGGQDLGGRSNGWRCLTDQRWCLTYHRRGLADHRWCLAYYGRGLTHRWWAGTDRWRTWADGWGSLANRWWCLPGNRRGLPGDLCGLPGQGCGLPALWSSLPSWRGGLPAGGCGQLCRWSLWALGNLWRGPYNLRLDLQDQRLSLWGPSSHRLCRGSHRLHHWCS